MKQAHLMYVCDQCGDEESPSAPRWAEAKKVARKAGWIVGKTSIGGDREEDICPSCKAHGR